MNRARLAWLAALIALCGSLVFFNLPAAAPDKAPAGAAGSAAGVAPPGHAVGEQLPDFTIDCLDGAQFTLDEHRGQVTVINLWATWCSPCVNELPFFDLLQRNHPQDVSVLAIHSDLITDDVTGYLSGFDYGIAFAVDEGGGVIASLGGSTMLPQTVVLDPRGVVTYNQVGSVTYEALEQLVEQAASGGEASG